jgi:UTP--glucose-1-phosphate uridylyltransferase
LWEEKIFTTVLKHEAKKERVMITKVIIPAAGLGTRFLPQTKAVPKEMLPIVDKPALHYIIEECFAAGINSIIVVTTHGKQSIENYFEFSPHFEYHLQSTPKKQPLENLNKLLKGLTFTYVYQGEPLGLGHAVWKARHAVGSEYVAIMLPDDIIINSTPNIAQLAKIAHQEKCNVVAVREVPADQVSSYGIIGIKKQFSPNLFQVRELIEKPSIEAAPSNLAIVGRYVLSSSIFEMLEDQHYGAIGEIQLTDAIQRLLLSGEKVFAHKIQGQHFDVGTPTGWLKANICLMLQNPEYGRDMVSFLEELNPEMIAMQGKAGYLKKQNARF